MLCKNIRIGKYGKKSSVDLYLEGILYILRKWDIREKRIIYITQNKCEEIHTHTHTHTHTHKQKNRKSAGCSCLCTGILPKVYFSGQQKNSPSSLYKNNIAFELLFLCFPLFLTSYV